MASYPRGMETLATALQKPKNLEYILVCHDCCVTQNTKSTIISNRYSSISNFNGCKAIIHVNIQMDGHTESVVSIATVQGWKHT
jgi:hypothetical protein